MGYMPSKEKKSWVAPTPKREKWKRAKYPAWLIRFYNSALWRKTSKRNLAKNPFCVECKKRGIVRKADVTDHIIPAIQGGSLLDPRNHQSLCTSDHNSKSAAESNGTSEPFIYVGKYKIPQRNAEQKQNKETRHNLL